jgi:D-3-phosphoglycerate dehydrogenase / 2-oxoglutarate reductase
MKIAITPSTFAAKSRAPLELLESRGIEVIPNPYGRRFTREEITALVQTDVDGLLAGLEPLDKDVLQHAKQLKAIARVGIGMANVDIPYAEGHGIKVSNTPEGPTEAVAEMTLTAALTLVRGVVARNEALHRREWPKHVVLGLKGLPVLFIGYGRIGRRSADLFRALGAEILVHDPYLDEDSLVCGERIVDLEEGLKESRVVTLHSAGEDQILGAAEINLLQDGSFLLNSARGGLVSEDAVCDALDSGKLAGVWFDAFWEEPYSGRLCDYPQALLTPHACTYTEQCRLGMEMQAAENLVRDLGL